jgi:hypothetical protein
MVSNENEIKKKTKKEVLLNACTTLTKQQAEAALNAVARKDIVGVGVVFHTVIRRYVMKEVDKETQGEKK